MPRHYQRKREKYLLENLKKAVEDVRKNKVTLSQASSTHSVPRTTIFDHLDEEIVNQPKSGRRCVFNDTQEKELEEHILKCSQHFNVLTVNTVRKIAFKFAEFYKLKHNFGKVTQMAGKDWYYGFIKRHPDIVLSENRKLKSTVSGTTAVNVTEVLQFSDNLMALKRPHHVDDDDDDTGNTGTSNIKKKPRNIKTKKIGIKSNGPKRKKNVEYERDREAETIEFIDVRNIKLEDQETPLQLLYPDLEFEEL